MAIRFHGAERLVDALEAADREVVFIVGSALVRPALPGPGGLVEQVKLALAGRRNGRARLAELEQALAKAPPERRCGLAFEHLKSVGRASACAAVVREAVLRAYDGEADAAGAEADHRAWALTPAVKALGLILARGDRRFGGPVLTTNVDPLIEVAIRAAGGQANGVHHLRDGSLATTHGPAVDVMHLNGHWLDETWQTPDAVGFDRKALRRALARLLDGRIAVVLGYPGADDPLTAALVDVLEDLGARPEVLWGFFEQSEGEIWARHRPLLSRLGRIGDRAVFYRGVDVHVHLPRLRARLDGEHEIIGRTALCNDLLRALDGTAPVEIIGERFMGRSRLLAWLEDKARMLGRSVVQVNAGHLAEKTPVALLRAIAEKQGRGYAMQQALMAQSAVPDDRDAVRCLGLLDGLLILVDDADHLAEAGNGFTRHFFDEFRARIQAQAVQWVSVSQQPLGVFFGGQGLNSTFLNDAVQHVAGGLDRREVEVALRARLGAEVAERALAMTGTLPLLVERVCAAEFGDVEGTLERLGAWGEGMFACWWARPEEERAVLRTAIGGVDDYGLSELARRLVNTLDVRGLLIEGVDGFVPNGTTWKSHVSGR